MGSPFSSSTENLVCPIREDKNESSREANLIRFPPPLYIDDTGNLGKMKKGGGRRMKKQVPFPVKEKKNPLSTPSRAVVFFYSWKKKERPKVPTHHTTNTLCSTKKG
jgi:hypothetical protein